MNVKLILLLLTVCCSRQPLRISCSYHNKMPVIVKAVRIATSFLRRYVFVTPLASPIKAPRLCVEYETPVLHWIRGVPDSDLHLYVIRQQSNLTYAATGKSCSYASSGALLLHGRPLIGRIIVNRVSSFS